MILCFFAVTSIAFSQHHQAAEERDVNLIAEEAQGVIFATVGAALYAMANISNRKLKQVHYSVIGFYNTLFGSMLYGGVLLILSKRAGTSSIPFAQEAWTYKLVAACTFWEWIGFNLRNISYQKDTSGFMALIGYTTVVYGFAADIFIFKDEISQVDLFSAMLIIIVTVGTALYKLQM